MSGASLYLSVIYSPSASIGAQAQANAPPSTLFKTPGITPQFVSFLTVRRTVLCRWSITAHTSAACMPLSESLHFISSAAMLSNEVSDSNSSDICFRISATPLNCSAVNSRFSHSLFFQTRFILYISNNLLSSFISCLRLRHLAANRVSISASSSPPLISIISSSLNIVLYVALKSRFQHSFTIAQFLHTLSAAVSKRKAISCISTLFFLSESCIKVSDSFINESAVISSLALIYSLYGLSASTISKPKSVNLFTAPNTRFGRKARTAAAIGAS